MKNRYSFRLLIENPEFRKWVYDQGSDQEWKSIYENDPESRHAIDAAREYLLAIAERPKELSELNKKRVWSQIRNEVRLKSDPKILPLHEGVKSRRLVRQKWSILAVACMVILVVGAFLFMMSNPPHSAPQMIVKSTATGQKSKIHLPDGSVVYLNAESELIYDEFFSKEHRYVTLKGEGYFDVAKNPNLPFTVKSHNVLTTALGTIFNIDAESESDISIHLVEGRIKVKDESHEAANFLEKGEKIGYQKDIGFTEVSRAEDLMDIAWKDGILVFENAPLMEVERELEKWYGVEINIAGNAGGRLTFSGTYDNEYLSNVLKSMSFSMGFQYEIDGKDVKLKF